MPIFEKPVLECPFREVGNLFLDLLLTEKTVVFIFDSNGRYVDIATQCPNLLYRPAKEIIGKTVHEIFPPHLAQLAQDTINEALETRKCISTEYELDINDMVYWFDATAIPFTENHVLWLARDFTDVKTGERLILDALSAIEELSSSSDETALLNEKVIVD